MAGGLILWVLAVVPSTAVGSDAAVRYRRICGPCHGQRGDGLGPAAGYLPLRPRDFTRGEYKFRSTPSGSLPLDSDLARTIRRGLPGTPMPAWRGALSEEEIGDVVRVVKSFSRRFADEPAPSRLQIPRPPRFDARLVREGRRTWKLFQCASCHGPRGRGDGPSVPGLRDSDGLPIRPRDFTVGIYKGGSSPRDVYRTFMTGLDGTPMPSYMDTLADERARWALVAYVQSLGRRPSFFDWLFADPLVSRAR
ncbi:MAG: c-type cytochrome [Deltaproteobacteria bacterium]|nr:c-type cytochrome [Deltaproteobacteria bacterium]